MYVCIHIYACVHVCIICMHLLVSIIDVKNVFYVFYYFFYKERIFNVFIFLERFLFSSGEIIYTVYYYISLLKSY